MTSRPAAAISAPRISLAAGIVFFAACLVYANSLAAPFVFDDLPAVRDNASIRQLRTALFPPPTAGSAAGRPLINLSFALNHALGGDNPVGYHLLNALIHAAAAVTLFGLVRRTCQLPVLRPRWSEAAAPVAFVAALLWAVHPLLTESVTCIAQRTESLAGLWLLLMFHCLARAADAPAPRRWLAGSFGACLLGVLTKEVMVVGPVLAYFYHALLVDGSWRAAWERRRRFLGLLAMTWIPLAALVAFHGPRFGAGEGEGIRTWEYALTQCRAILLYLKLSFWPHPLVMDHGNAVNHSLAEVWPQALLLLGLLVATALAVVRKWPAAFAGLWFFAILAPSSSVLPLFTQTIAEHRMYLPLAAIVVLVVAGGQALAGRRAVLALGLAALPLGYLTVQRNADYRTPLAIWRDTAAKAPDNPRAHTNLGNLLDEEGSWEEALREYRTAIRIQPDYALAHANLTQLLVRRGRVHEVTAEYRELARREPRFAIARLNLGNLLALQEDWAGAEVEFEAVTRLEPDDPIAYHGLGSVLFNQGRPAEAAAAFARALPKLDGPELRFNLGVALADSGQPNAALEHFAVAARQDPANAEVRYRIGALLLEQGRPAEAVARLRDAIRIDPRHDRAREALRQLGQMP